jgi:hypothetical protein
MDRTRELSAEARAQIAGYVTGGVAGSGKEQLTHVLGEQGMMCDALAYRACMAAMAARATAPQMREMMQLAMGSCGTTPRAEPQPTVAVGAPPSGPVVPVVAERRVAEPSAPVTAGADADWAPGTYMATAVSRVVGAAHELEQKSKYGFDDDGACVTGAYVHVKRKLTMTRPFRGGVDYILLGAGSDSAKDVDLGVGVHGGALLAADTDNDPTPVVKFTPPKDGNYDVHLVLESATSDAAFAAVAIMRVGGYGIPVENLTTSFRTALRSAGEASKKVAEKTTAAGLVFHEQDDWSFYGSVLKQGERIQFAGLDLTSTLTVAVAGGDAQAQDIDLDVVDTTDGNKVVAKDDDRDATPAVVVRPDKGHTYGLGVKVSQAKGATLVTALVLDAEQR